MPTIVEIRERIQSSGIDAIGTTAYCRRRALLRGVDLQQAKFNLVERQDGVWKFSQHAGLKGRRIEVFFKVSSRKVHKYILEVNEVVYLMNTIVIDGKKQRRLQAYDLR